MFKKTTILIALVALLLTACSTSKSPQAGSPGTGNTRELNAVSKLIIGTLKLDGTAQAVTKDQAKTLIPLWDVYKQLMSSDTAAQAEIDGLASQIDAAMTADQHKAIDAMKLTQADMMTFMQGQAGAGPSGSAPSGSSQGNGSSGTGQSGNSSRTNNSGGNGGPAGGPPDGGGFDPGGGGFPGGPSGSTASGTPRATGTQTANGGAPRNNPNRVPTFLIDAVIQYLQKIAAS